jgi:hypothetical protein
MLSRIAPEIWLFCENDWFRAGPHGRKPEEMPMIERRDKGKETTQCP